MMNQRFRYAVLIAGTLLVVGGFCGNLVCGEDRDPSLSDEYRSSSKRFVLRMIPNGPAQHGGAEYCLFRDDREIWRKIFPYTLASVRVLDDGTVVACGYSQGVEGLSGKYSDHPGDYGDVFFLVLNPEGTVRVKEAFHRVFAPRVMSPQHPEPLIEDILVDLENDRVVLLTAWNVYQFTKPSTRAWRTYQLSTGKPLGVFYPAEQMKSARWLGVCIAVQPLPGTPLFVAQWRRLEGELSLRSPPTSGTHFALLDGKCSPVWQLTLRDDYEVSDNEERRRKLSNWIMDNGAILSVNTPGRFDLYFAKKGQKVSFAARQDEQGKWIVTEIGRKGFTPQTLLVPPKNTNQSKPVPSNH